VFEALGSPEILLGVAAFLATVFVPALYRRRRKILYDVMADFRLLDEKPESESKEVVVAGRKMTTNPRVFVVDVNNHAGRDIFGMFGGFGGVDITPAHYERPISFHFGDDASILDAKVTEEHPPGIRELVCVHRNKIVLKPVLLNHGDALQLKVLVENPDEMTNLVGQEIGIIEVGGRITGIRSIQRSWSTLAYLLIGSEMTSLGGLLLVGIDIVLPTVLGYPPFERHPFVPDHEWLFSTLFGFSSALLAGGLITTLMFHLRHRLASGFKRDIRAYYLDTKSD
jgi:hypothetical protein